MIKNDGWLNVLAGLSGRSDKTQSTYFGDYLVLDDDTLTQQYIGDGLSKRIINRLPDDMTRAWVNIINDSDTLIEQEMERLSVQSIFREALVWMRLYRGAIVVMGVNDGMPLDRPLGKTPRQISWLKCYPANNQIPVNSASIVNNPKSPYFDEIEYYDIHKTDGGLFRVHASRCIVFKGEKVPNASGVEFKTRYWGMSALQAVYDRLRNFGAVEQGIANLMLEFVIGKYKLTGLAQLLAENNTDAVYTRMEIINQSKSLINSVLLGEGEEYTRDTANVGGLPELLDRFMIMISAVSGYPVTLLFGRSPAGQNATGESDLTNYYDMVSAMQHNYLENPLNQLVKYISGYVYGENRKDIPSIEFNSVWEPTLRETVEMQNKQAQTDAIYIENGVLSNAEVRASRFENGYGYNTII